MGLNRRRPEKCVYFDSARGTSSVYEHAPELARKYGYVFATLGYC